MGVYIKGMEMPKNCYKCPLRRRDGMDIVCPVAHERFSVADVNILEYRLNDCPLVPVPPHGKLIEKNAVFELIRSFPNVDRQLPVEFMKALYELPTIIEGEEEKS